MLPLHRIHLQIDGSTGTASIEGSDFSDKPVKYCDDTEASLNIPWMNDSYSLTLDFTVGCDDTV